MRIEEQVMRMSDPVKGVTKKRIIIALAVTSCTLLILWSFLTVERFPGHAQLQSWLLGKLVVSQPLPAPVDELHPEAKKIIYVLGGSQKSLRFRFKTAGELYKKGMADRIMILGRPGITEYDSTKKRNLKNDEWAVKRFQEFGVRGEAITTVSLEYGFFGTLTEAKGISKKIVNEGYDILVLVSSSYHTARVLECFGRYLRNTDVILYIYGSDDNPRLRGLLTEYFKLVIYRNFLL